MSGLPSDADGGVMENMQEKYANAKLNEDAMMKEIKQLRISRDAHQMDEPEYYAAVRQVFINGGWNPGDLTLTDDELQRLSAFLWKNETQTRMQEATSIRDELVDAGVIDQEASDILARRISMHDAGMKVD